MQLKKIVFAGVLIASLTLNVVQYCIGKEPILNEKNLHGTYICEEESLMLYMYNSDEISHDFEINSYNNRDINALDAGDSEKINDHIYKLSGDSTYYLMRSDENSLALLDTKNDQYIEYVKIEDQVYIGGIPSQIMKEYAAE